LDLRWDMEDSKPEGQAFTPEEVAERLNVHVATVHELLKSGSLKGFKLTRQWRVRPEDLKEFMSRPAVSQ
jgi:excisionase family DNA binding protein